MKPVALTHHGIQRGKQRAGLDKPALEKTAAKALSDGLVAGDTNGRLRRYMDGMLIEHKGANIRIHGNHIFCFRGEVLVTVLDLPLEHRRAALSARTKREDGRSEASCKLAVRKGAKKP